MDMAGHRTEDCWSLKHKIQDLIDLGVITVDSTKGKYEVCDQFKVHFVSSHDPPRYSRENPFIIKSSGPYEKDQ